MDKTTSTLNDLCAERGDWLDIQAQLTRQLDRDGYYREANPKIARRIGDLTEQIELLDTLQWLAPLAASDVQDAHDPMYPKEEMPDIDFENVKEIEF